MFLPDFMEPAFKVQLHALVLEFDVFFGSRFKRLSVMYVHFIGLLIPKFDDFSRIGLGKHPAFVRTLTTVC